MNTKKAFIILCLVVLISCTASPKEPLKIGVVATLSGVGAFQGQQELRGLELAVNEINAIGGIDGRPELVPARGDAFWAGRPAGQCGGGAGCGPGREGGGEPHPVSPGLFPAPDDRGVRHPALRRPDLGVLNGVAGRFKGTYHLFREE